MKKLLLFALSVVVLLIHLMPDQIYAAKKREVCFINDTPINQVLSLKYDLSAVGLLSPLLGSSVSRVVWLKAGEIYTIEMPKNCCHKYVGVIDFNQHDPTHFEKIQWGKPLRISTLCGYQKRDLYGQEASVHAYPGRIVEEAKKLVKARKAVLKKVGHDVNRDAFELAIFAPERISKWILNMGFQNQYQIGSSRGRFDPLLRQTGESRSLAMDVTEYQQISHDVLPKYGMVFSKSFFTGSLNSLRSQYGEDIYLLKWENLKDQLTWTNGSPIDPRDKKGFIPWSVKLPHSSKSVKKYREFQVWGPVMPSDIKAFIFTRMPPDSGTMRLLMKYGIEIYDGRQGCPVSRYSGIEEAA